MSHLNRAGHETYMDVLSMLMSYRIAKRLNIFIMKSVHELNQNELEELRSRWYSQHEDDGSLEEVIGLKEATEEDVSFDVVKSYYEDTFFVEEDFFCNIQG